MDQGNQKIRSINKNNLSDYLDFMISENHILGTFSNLKQYFEVDLYNFNYFNEKDQCMFSYIRKADK